jgi:hypothetical protein
MLKGTWGRIKILGTEGLWSGHNRYSGAVIAQWYSARRRTWWSGVLVPAGTENFSPHHRVQTGSGTHPASYPMGARGSFPGAKASEASKLTTHLHLVPRSRMRGAITPLPQQAFMALCSVKEKAQWQLYFYLYLIIGIHLEWRKKEHKLHNSRRDETGATQTQIRSCCC